MKNSCRRHACRDVVDLEPLATCWFSTQRSRSHTRTQAHCVPRHRAGGVLGRSRDVHDGRFPALACLHPIGPPPLPRTQSASGHTGRRPVVVGRAV